MKRLFTILAVLLLLIIVTGFDPVPMLRRLLIRDDRYPRAATEQVHTQEEPPLAAVRDRKRSSALPSSSTDIPTATAARGARIDSSGNPSETMPVVTLTGEISPVYFIRGTAITGTATPSPQQQKQLTRAVEAVLRAMRQQAAILDADYLGDRQTPGLLYGRPGLDITAQVAAVYAAMLPGPVEVITERENAPDDMSISPWPVAEPNPDNLVFGK